MELKIAILIIVVSVSNVFATPSYSQVARVSLNMKDQSLEKVMDEIERQSDFYFIFNQKQIDINRVVDIEEDNKLITDVLPELFRGTNVNYAVFDRKILLTTDPIENNLLAIASGTKPQQKQITGTVTDKDGNLLPGVNVVVTGTTVGVITDIAGKYSIKVSPEAKSLTFSFIGMQIQEINIGSSPQIDVTLVESAVGLDEVVVVGYGTQMKREITGAISSVKTGDLNKSASTNFAQTLEGKVAGLTALQTTGQPGANVELKIRSNPSFASSGVLYVLDGIPINNDAGDPGTITVGTSGEVGTGGVDRSPLNFINTNDIESIDVLKDASAASIYGARAGAGVILITTKHGKEGKPRIEYNVNYAFQRPAKFYNILNTHDYMVEENKFLKEIWMNQYKIAPYGSTDQSTVNPYTPRYTDAQIANAPQGESAMKAISGNGLIEQHNLTLSGVNSGTSYYISGNYLTQQGVIKDNDYTRYNSKINLEQTVSNHIKVGVNLTTSNSNAKNASTGMGTGENSGIIATAMIYPPTLPLIDSLGNYPLNPLYTKSSNPLSFLTVSDQTVYSRLVTNGYVEWTIFSGLKAKADFNYDQSISKRSTYDPKSFLYGNTVNGLAYIGENTSKAHSMEYTLNYEHDFGGMQKLNVLGGYSYQISTLEGLSASTYGFLTDNFLYNNLGLGSAPRPTVGSNKSEQVWASYFARAIYSIKNRYLLQASVRRDGSSIFAKNRKYGIFPSVSAGWVISDESFFKNNISFLNFLKLRTSYGTTGNSNIGSNAYSYYSSGYNYVFGGAINSGVYLSQLENNNLTWETTREIDFGLDFQILKNRISGSFDYFNKIISNLLTFRPLPADYPVPSVADNVGKTRSTGWEIAIQSKNIIAERNNGFEWSTAITLSHYYDCWVQRSPAALQILEKYIDPKGPFNGIYGYVSDGIYTGTGEPPASMPGIIPGTLIVKDLNGYDPVTGNLTGKPDGKISSADETLLGLNDPSLNFGINNSFSYKNFYLSIYMYGITGVKFNYDYARALDGDLSREFSARAKNQVDIILDRWSSGNMNSKYPSGLTNTYTGYGFSSDLWIEKNNFLRCQDITLGYTVPSSIVQKLKILSSLNVNLSVKNAFIITKYTGLDPELQNFYAYPNPISFVVGLNASF